MDNWEYRVIRHQWCSAISDKYQENVAIHKVYFDEKGRPSFISENAIKITDDNFDKLRYTLTKMVEALEKPILDFSDF